MSGMHWLKRYKHLLKETPPADGIDIDEALERLACNSCGGPLNATLVPIGQSQEAWDFRCQDEGCESHTEH